MIDPSYCQLMANYNQWMNSRMYALCAQLDEQELLAPRGLFFESIYLTLNHIMYGDQAFMARFKRTGEYPAAIGDELYSGFAELHRERQAFDQQLIDWSGELSHEWLKETLSYTSKVDNKPRTVEHWILVTHLFNHQTHHRGQVTTALSQLGHDMGSTDIPFMPGVGTTG
jgi:uncharacterized damage-inducible protein DinB